MTEPTVEVLVERVRSYIESHVRIVDGPDETFTRELAPSARPALAALDSLTAALERAERQLVEADGHGVRLLREKQAAEARAQKAEADRDAERELKITLRDQFDDLWAAHRKAEAVVEAARRLLLEADNASPEIGEYPLDAWLNLVDTVRAYDEPPTE